MNQLLCVLGPSDIEAQNTIEMHAAGRAGQRVDAEVAGVLPILPFIMNDRTLAPRSQSMLLGLHELELSRNARLNIFNLVGDADSSPLMLRKIQALVARARPIRCFNRPENVFRTSREALPRTLADIPGCRVPRVEAVKPGNFGELEAACSKFGCWPLIIRARGYHGGEHMQLVNDPEQLAKIGGEAWLYEGIHLIEFVDFKVDNVLYQKIRVIMIDGVPYPRHSVFSDRWAIHGGSRRDLMAADPDLCAREAQYLAYLRDTGLNEYAAVFSEIYRRIDLDIFGIDFAMVDDQLVIFEANACMNFLIQGRPNNRYSYLESYTSALKRAVKRMLVKA